MQSTSAPTAAQSMSVSAVQSTSAPAAAQSTLEYASLQRLKEGRKEAAEKVDTIIVGNLNLTSTPHITRYVYFPDKVLFSPANNVTVGQIFQLLGIPMPQLQFRLTSFDNINVRHPRSNQRPPG